MNAERIAEKLGGRKAGGGWTACCPAHKDKHPSLRISKGKGGKVLFHCFAGCEQDDVIGALRRLRLWPGNGDATASADERSGAAQHSESKREKQRDAFVERLWRGTWDTAGPAWGSPVENWLRVRGIALDPAELDRMPLRWSIRCPLGKDSAPAMIALMTDPVTAEPWGIHRTFLLPDGSAKALGAESRKMLGSAGVIRLSPDDEVSEGLAICEGIETGLAITAFGWRPIWACGSLEALKRFPTLSGIQCLTVFADPKPNEIAGARACAARWAHANRETTIRIPHGGDWNDLLRLAA